MTNISFGSIFLLLLIPSAEAGDNEPTVTDLQMQIKALLKYREEDLLAIETLKAQRAEDHRALEKLTRDVEHHNDVIRELLKEKKQNGKTIKLLSEKLDTVLEDRKTDRNIIRTLEKAVYRNYKQFNVGESDSSMLRVEPFIANTIGYFKKEEKEIHTSDGNKPQSFTVS